MSEQETRTRPGITILPSLIEAGKSKAKSKGISFSRWIESLIRNNTRKQ